MSARAAGAHEKYNVDEQDAGGHEAKASKKEAILEQRRERARQEARRHNKHLRVTRRPRKPDAPGGWEALWSEASGKWFFWCPLTGATTWERRECTHTQANLRTALGELPAGESPYRRGQASAGSSQARPPRTPRVRLLAARPPSPRAAADEHARAPVTASTPRSRIGPHPPSTSESAAALRRTHRPSTSERRPTPRRGAADTVDDMPYKLGATTRPSTAPSRARSPLVGSSAASARHSVRVTLATGGQSWRTRARAALPREFRHVKSVPAASEAALGESAAPGGECYQIGSYVRLKDLDVPLSNGALSHNQTRLDFFERDRSQVLAWCFPTRAIRWAPSGLEDTGRSCRLARPRRRKRVVAVRQVASRAFHVQEMFSSSGAFRLTRQTRYRRRCQRA